LILDFVVPPHSKYSRYGQNFTGRAQRRQKILLDISRVLIFSKPGCPLYFSEKNIISDDGTNVTFRYRESQSGDWKTRRVKGEHFIWLVFQHALPKGFRRVRDYGFLHGNAKITLRRIQLLLKVFLPAVIKTTRPALACKHCGSPMAIIAFIPPTWRAG